MKHSHVPIAVVLAFFLLSCEKNNLGTVDVQTNVPILANPVVTPDSIYIDNQVPIGGQYSVSSVLRVKMSSARTTQDVIAKVLRPTSTESVAEVALKDDGTSPDQTANDSVYSGQVQFAISRPQSGRYRVQFIARDPSGTESNTLEKVLKLGRRNSAPRLSNLNAPDALVLPPADSLLINMNIAASDSDGIGDIAEVFFRSLDSSNPSNKFQLRDDGGANNSPSGDERAGDGVYSIVIKLVDSPTIRRTYRFAFQAADSFNDTSGTLLHSLTIQ